jgi:hypothetical protein
MNTLAYFWLSISKDPRAKDNLLYLESIMTPTEMGKASKMIQHHRDTHTDERIENRGDEEKL